jgi:putative serine protease PepD
MANDTPGWPGQDDRRDVPPEPEPERSADGSGRTEEPAGSGPAPDPWSREAPTRAWSGGSGPGPQDRPHPPQPAPQHPAGSPGGHPVPGGGHGAPGYGWSPPGGAPGRPGRGAEPRRRGLASVLAFALAAALLGGTLGGLVGYSLAVGDSGRSGGSSGVLSEPLPDADPSETPLGPVEAVADRVLSSVVQLRVEATQGRGEGSGIVLSADGLLLTNNHVVEPAEGGGTITAVFHDGTIAPAQIVGRDPSSDLAVIRAQDVAGLTPVELGDSESVRVGQQVVAFGSPLGLGGTVTTGIISALDRAVSVGRNSGASESTVLNALQTDAAINPGNSGGPLVDMQGRVVGINSAIATTGGPQGGSIGVGFAIPVNQARRIAQELESTGRASHAVLGVSVTLGPDQPPTGAVLGPVVPGGPADRAGLRAGQVVTRFDGRVITNNNELVAAIRDKAPNDQVTLVVDGREVVVTLGEETG